MCLRLYDLSGNIFNGRKYFFNLIFIPRESTKNPLSNYIYKTSQLRFFVSPQYRFKKIIFALKMPISLP